jgi:hypothetical protein
MTADPTPPFSSSEGRQADILKLLMELNSVYHNHKEQMALSIFGLEAAFFVGLFLLGSWPPDVMKMQRRPMVVIFVLVWVMFHLALRYQLRNRRLSAIIHAAYVDALLQTEDIQYEKSSHTYRPPHGFAQLIDLTLIPMRGALRSSDIALSHLADGSVISPATRQSFEFHLAKHQNDSAVSWTKYALPIEWLTTLGSMFLLLIALYRVTAIPV